jgi:ligand-binding SRPBCC domain-containing protein
MLLPDAVGSEGAHVGNNEDIRIERAASGYVLEARLWLPRPAEAIFAFFADAMNLQRLTPDWLKFEVLTPAPIVMQTGTLIDYRLKVRGMPFRWQSEITAWDPPRRFVDEATQGPYRFWRHEHTFAPLNGGTDVGDRVEYDVPGGALTNRLLVAPDLRRIFAFRQEVLRGLFASAPAQG